MAKGSARVFFRLLCFVLIIYSGISMSATTKTGVVTAVEEGILSIGGVQHRITIVNTEGGGTIRVAVPVMGVQQPLKIGESLSFSGPRIHVNNEPVINTREGFIYRSAQNSMAEYMAQQRRKAMARFKAMRAKAEKTGIPTAVPIMVKKSTEQRQASKSRRYTDIVLTLLTIFVAILAIDSVRAVFSKPARWAKSRIGKRSAD